MGGKIVEEDLVKTDAEGRAVLPGYLRAAIEVPWDPGDAAPVDLVNNESVLPMQRMKFSLAAKEFPNLLYDQFEIIDSDKNLARFSFYAKADTQKQAENIGMSFYRQSLLTVQETMMAMLDTKPQHVIDSAIEGVLDAKEKARKAIVENVRDTVLPYWKKKLGLGDDDDEAAEEGEGEGETFRFQHQCFLTSYWDVFAAANKNKTYDNFVQVGGNGVYDYRSASEVVEKLTAVPNIGNIMRIPPVVLSTLTPQVRLYKVRKKAGKTKLQEFIFNDHLSSKSVEKMTMSAHARGQGVGLKSFEWKKDGRDPAEATRSIQVKMVLHFSSMLDLVADNGKPEDKIRWMDLISPSASITTGNKSNTGECGQPSREHDSFTIRAVVGYNKPTPSMWKPYGIAGDEYITMAKAVANCQISLDLSLTKHDIVLKEGGAVELTLQYHAWLEGVLLDKKADVLLLGLEQKFREEISETGKYSITEEFDKGIAKRLKNIETIKSQECDDPDREKKHTKAGYKGAIKAQKKQIADIEREQANEKNTRHRKILEALEKRGRVFKISVGKEEVVRLKEFQRVGRMSTRYRRDKKGLAVQGDQAATAKQTAGDAKKQSEANKAKIVDAIAKQASASDDADSTKLGIPYIYYGDLLDVALTVLNPVKEGGLWPSSKELKLIVGAYSFTDLQTGNQQSVNLADIPISIELYKAWFLENIIKINKERYPLKAFIRDTITGLISSAMTPTCFGQEQGIQGAPKIGINILEAPMSGSDKDPIDRVHPGAGSSAGRFGNLRIGIDEIRPFPDSIGQETNMGSYLLIYCSSFSGRQLKSDEKADEAAGRYWLRFGATGGLVKNIKFKKLENMGARESRLERFGNLDLSYLHEIYDADITLYGCPVFSPGCLVYIDPASIGIGPPTEIRKLAQRLGMGGYYIILEATSIIESGSFETFLKTKFESPGDVCGTGEGVVPLSAIGQNQEEEKCVKSNNAGVSKKKEPKGVLAKVSEFGSDVVDLAGGIVDAITGD